MPDRQAHIARSDDGQPAYESVEWCRDCGVPLTADNVWEPGTCRPCAVVLSRAEHATGLLAFGYTPCEDAANDGGECR